MRLAKISVLLLVLAVPSAHAFPPGGSLNWHGCLEDGMVSNEYFRCFLNTASETFAVTYVPTRDFHQFVGAEAFVDIRVAAPTLPAWWSRTCPGRNVVSVSLDAANNSSMCQTIWQNASLSGGGLAAYSVPIYIQHGVITPGAPNTAQIDVAGAVTALEPQDILADGTEYSLFSIKILGSHSTGTDACTGCSTPAQLTLQGIWVSELAPAPTYEDYTAGFQQSVTLNSTSVVPTLAHTWGALKAMYR